MAAQKNLKDELANDLNHWYAQIPYFFGGFTLLNNPKHIDPSYKTDLHVWDCSGRVKLVL